MSGASISPQVHGQNPHPHFASPIRVMSLSGHSTGLSTHFSIHKFTVCCPMTPLSSIFPPCRYLWNIVFTPTIVLPTIDPTDPHYANITCPKPHYPPPLQHSTTESSVSSCLSAEPSPNTQNDWESMQMSPQFDIPNKYSQPMDTAMSPVSQEFPVWPLSEPDALHNSVPYDMSAPVPKLHKASSFQFRKQRWPVLGGMFGNSNKNQLPPELHSSLQSHNNTASLKRTVLKYRKPLVARGAIDYCRNTSTDRSWEGEEGGGTNGTGSREAMVCSDGEGTARTILGCHAEPHQLIIESQTTQPPEWKGLQAQLLLGPFLCKTNAFTFILPSLPMLLSMPRWGIAFPKHWTKMACGGMTSMKMISLSWKA